MRMPKDDLFYREVECYAFKLTCEECIHFIGDTEQCSLLWPNANHRLEAVRDRSNTHVLFCKEFDLA